MDCERHGGNTAMRCQLMEKVCDEGKQVGDGALGTTGCVVTAREGWGHVDRWWGCGCWGDRGVLVRDRCAEASVGGWGAGNEVDGSSWGRGWVGCGCGNFHGVGFVDPHIAEEFEFGGGIARDVAGTVVPSMGSVTTTQTTLKPQGPIGGEVFAVV